jgi:hypothetical protein
LDGLNSGGNDPDAASDAREERALPESGADEAATDAGLDAHDASTLLFDDEFDADLSRWTLDDAGAWTLDGGELVEGLPVGAAEAFVTGFAEATDYRVESKMRILANTPAGAIEIAFRIDVATGDEWHCNWEPVPDDAGLTFLRLQQGANASVVDVPVDTNKTQAYSASAPMTMVVKVTNNVVDCTILEVNGAKASYGLIGIPRGTFGVRTYVLPAAFDYLRVYAATP